MLANHEHRVKVFRSTSALGVSRPHHQFPPHPNPLPLGGGEGETYVLPTILPLPRRGGEGRGEGAGGGTDKRSHALSRLWGWCQRRAHGNIAVHAEE